MAKCKIIRQGAEDLKQLDDAIKEATITTADILGMKDFWIKLLYNDREYNSLENWQATFEPYTGEYPPLYIYDEKFNEFGIDDRHPTKFTNQVIHDSILKKLKDRGVV